MTTASLVAIAASSLSRGQLARQYNISASMIKAIQDGKVSITQCQKILDATYHPMNFATRRNLVCSSPLIVL